MVAQNKQTFRGVTLDQPTIDALLVAEGLLGYQLAFAQGSYNAGGVAASAGTHDGGGAVDVEIGGGSDSTTTQVAKVHALRAAGFAAWRRTPSEGFAYHIHCEQIGNPWLSSSAAQQIVQWNAGENGLANQAADTDPIDVAAGRPAVVGSTPSTPRAVLVTNRKLDEDVFTPPAGGSVPPVTAGGQLAIPVSAVTYAKYNGGGNIDQWIQAACGFAGVPYNAAWRVGYETICSRESSDNPNAVNNYDSNATGPTVADGNPANCSRGDAQCIPSTFASYHCQGCSDDIYDAVACIASSIRYVIGQYGVSSDGSDLAAKVHQADPNHSPQGY